MPIDDAMVQARQEACVRVICPQCDEDIGLVGDELQLPLTHNERAGSFNCHVCRASWFVKATFEAVEDPDA